MEPVTVCESEEGLGLDRLPHDVLFGIFDYLDIRSLAALAATCQKFNDVINNEFLNFKSFSLLVTNQFSVEIQKRSLKLLSSLDKYHTNHRWRKKCYHERIFLNSKEKFRPWLSLTEHGVFIGRGKNIHLFGRNGDGFHKEPVKTFRGHSDDIGRFVVRDNLMVSSGNDGKLCCWDVNSGKLLYKKITPVGWNESVYVDWSRSNILAAGFNMAGIVKFLCLEDSGFVQRSEIKQNERVWSVALNYEGTSCSIGCAGYHSSPLKIYDLHRVWSVALNYEGTSCSIGCAGYHSSPLKIYDLHRGAYTLSIPENYKIGAGVFHTVWESPQVVISGSYDTYIRMWDLRTGDCERSWSDPYDAAVYTLATDNHWTILAGTSLHGRVTLWDKRLPNCVQMYYMKCADNAGPVYSLDFDPSYMFVALASSFHVLDFS